MLKNLRLLADPSRLRVLLLVEREELSVAELQEILGMGQSRISTHLAQLKQAGLLEDRRNGKSILYRLKTFRGAESKAFEQLLGVLRRAAGEIPEAEQDSEALRLALVRRKCARTSTNSRANSAGTTCRAGRGKGSPRRCSR
jgi:ArsR family transcriptional regulator